MKEKLWRLLGWGLGNSKQRVRKKKKLTLCTDLCVFLSNRGTE